MVQGGASDAGLLRRELRARLHGGFEGPRRDGHRAAVDPAQYPLAFQRDQVLLGSIADVQASVHLDHVEDLDLLHAVVQTDCSSAMSDGSKLDYDDNVAVGSSHAMSERTAALDFDLIADLRSAVPVPLVLHGSSGVADADLRRAVGAGITKVNGGTLLNVRCTAAGRAHLAANDVVTDPRRYLLPARTAVTEAVAAMITALD